MLRAAYRKTATGAYIALFLWVIENVRYGPMTEDEFADLATAKIMAAVEPVIVRLEAMPPEYALISVSLMIVGVFWFRYFPLLARGYHTARQLSLGDWVVVTLVYLPLLGVAAGWYVVYEACTLPTIPPMHEWVLEQAGRDACSYVPSTR